MRFQFKFTRSGSGRGIYDRPLFAFRSFVHRVEFLEGQHAGDWSIKGNTDLESRDTTITSYAEYYYTVIGHSLVPTSTNIRHQREDSEYLGPGQNERSGYNNGLYVSPHVW